MADKRECFPSNQQEALAYLYVTLHAQENMEPESLADMYKDAYKKICDRMKVQRTSE